MVQVFDVMVVGLGANGSSALYHLAGTEKKVVGIDRWVPPHNHGSSHGESRIIRQAYHESPLYVPLVKAAYPIWRELEKAAGKKLFLQTGGLMLGRPDASVISGARLSAEAHDIPYEYLDALQLKKRFPALRPAPDTVGMLEKEAGILFPEMCIRAFLEQAAVRGAALHYSETVLHIDPSGDKIAVTTTAGDYQVEKLILSAGAWINQLLPGLHLPLTVERQILYWFDVGDKGAHYNVLPERLPIYIWEYTAGGMFYGFPDLGTGVKVALHHKGHAILPDELTQVVSPEEIREAEDIVRTYLDIDPVFQRAAVCMYTNTPDENFIIDHHPAFRNIIIASPCSGHGFKFSSLTGRILSDLALGVETGFDLSPFTIQRPALAAAARS